MATQAKFVLMAAGAKLFDNYVASLDAEATGLELATHAISSFSWDFRIEAPHRVDQIFEAHEFLQNKQHLLNFSYIRDRR